jgi:hypothetical protein
MGQFDNPLTFHKYLYCLNSPLNFIDPWGLVAVAFYDGKDKGGTGIADGEDFYEAANDYEYYFDVKDDFLTAMGYTPTQIMGIAVLMLTDWYGEKIDDLYIFDHGSRGNQVVGDEHLDYRSGEWKWMTSMLESTSMVHLRGCNVARDQEGKDYIKNLAKTGNVYVDAYDDYVFYKDRWLSGDHWSEGNLWLTDGYSMDK